MTNYYEYRIEVRYHGKESPLNVLKLNAAESTDDARRIVLEARKPSKETIIEKIQAIKRTKKPTDGLEITQIE